jgi:Flp pilus assembly protein TadG
MSTQSKPQRRAVITVNVAILLVPIMAFLALALDCGYLLKVRTELQSAADAAALAAVRELIPGANGIQNLDQAIETARALAQQNMGGANAFVVNDADIQIGRYDPSSIYSSVNLLDNGTFDTVRVTVRRDHTTNSAVRLYFARVIGIADCDVTATATAILPQANVLRPGDGVLPFGLSNVGII